MNRAEVRSGPWYGLDGWWWQHWCKRRRLSSGGPYHSAAEANDAARAHMREAHPCPTCQGLIRETVGMVCQTCGLDYAPNWRPGELIAQPDLDGIGWPR